jgi:hypothetical protein
MVTRFPRYHIRQRAGVVETIGRLLDALNAQDDRPKTLGVSRRRTYLAVRGRRRSCRRNAPDRGAAENMKGRSVSGPVRIPFRNVMPFPPRKRPEQGCPSRYMYATVSKPLPWSSQQTSNGCRRGQNAAKLRERVTHLVLVAGDPADDGPALILHVDLERLKVHLGDSDPRLELVEAQDHPGRAWWASERREAKGEYETASGQTRQPALRCRQADKRAVRVQGRCAQGRRRGV